MSFDLFQSRRNMNEYCRWWLRNESEEEEEDKLIYKRVPAGYFYAVEVTAEVQDDNMIGGVFMADKTSVTIKSSDDLSNIYNYNENEDIRNKVIVEYQGQLWRVDNVQKRKARIQNSEFANPELVSHYWYLSLIKG